VATLRPLVVNAAEPPDIVTADPKFEPPSLIARFRSGTPVTFAVKVSESPKVEGVAPEVRLKACWWGLW